MSNPNSWYLKTNLSVSHEAEFLLFSSSDRCRLYVCRRIGIGGCYDAAIGECGQRTVGRIVLIPAIDVLGCGGRIKIYFFILILSRSKYKYVYSTKTPSTSNTAIYAHKLAFKHMNGHPKKLIYDQDRVFIKDENLSDCKLTARFRAFCSSEKIDVMSYRKSDPQSNGKVENVVKYVKHNFVSAIEFKDINTLNSEAIGWLERTAIGTMHNGIRGNTG